jgi:hypothetical protein
VNERLLAKASRRDVTAVSTDDPAGYGIIDTSSGTEPAAKEGFADNESAGDLLHFLIAQSASANPAKHAILFHGMLLYLTF